MSMPNIPDITPIIDLDRDEAITLLLASIAVEEMGLAHILNAEGEKLQYVMGLKDKSGTCLHDILAVNESVERVIQSVTRLQLILESKLDSVIRLIPKESYPGPCPPPKPPRPPKPPKPPKPEFCCTLLGSGVGCVHNKGDNYYGATVTLQTLENCDRGYYPLKYTLFKKGKGSTVSAVLMPFIQGLTVRCPSIATCPTPKNPSILVMEGKGMMCFSGFPNGNHRENVNFKLKVWDYGLKQQFQMITWHENNELYNHDSGIVVINQGNLAIKPVNAYDNHK